jgi:hypothetical protein
MGAVFPIHITAEANVVQGVLKIIFLGSDYVS